MVLAYLEYSFFLQLQQSISNRRAPFFYIFTGAFRFF